MNIKQERGLWFSLIFILALIFISLLLYLLLSPLSKTDQVNIVWNDHDHNGQDSPGDVLEISNSLIYLRLDYVDVWQGQEALNPFELRQKSAILIRAGTVIICKSSATGTKSVIATWAGKRLKKSIRPSVRTMSSVWLASQKAIPIMLFCPCGMPGSQRLIPLISGMFILNGMK